MKLITAIVRPEKVMDVIKALEQEGYFAFSKWAISGRGKEKGIQVGDVLYQEIGAKVISRSVMYLRCMQQNWYLNMFTEHTGSPMMRKQGRKCAKHL